MNILILVLTNILLLLPSLSSGFILIEDDPFAKINETIKEYISHIPREIKPEDVKTTFEDLHILRGELLINNVIITGIRDTYASVISLTDSTHGESVNITFNIPEISLGFTYNIDALAIESVPLYGAGNNYIVFENVEVQVKAPINSTKEDVDDIWIAIYIKGRSSFFLKGLIDDNIFSALVSNALNDNFSNFVNHNSEVVSRILIFIIKHLYGVPTLAEVTSQQIIQTEQGKMVDV